MPKRDTVNLELPLEFTLFTPTYRAPTYRLVVAVAYRFAAAYVKPGRLEWQLQHLCAGVWSCQNVPP